MSLPTKIRAIVADDSALTRRALSRLLDQDPEIEVVGFARDGVDAVVKAREHKPDVITLDINMPKQDGITALQEILSEEICPAIMVSSLTQKGATTTYEALALGAFDFVAKPNGSVSGNFDSVGSDLVRKVKAAARFGKRSTKDPRLSEKFEPTYAEPEPKKPMGGPPATRAIAIGISTGGPSTIMEVLPKLPSDIDAAILLVQHMPLNFTGTFAKRLAKACRIDVVAAEAGMTVQSGVCYVAQGGKHLEPYRKADGSIILRTPASPKTLFVPSADVMMDATHKAFGAQNTIGILMTGIGDDGADAMASLKKAGAYTIGESEETAVVYGMPRVAKERDGVCEEVPSWKISELILNRLKRKTAATPQT